MDYLWIIEVSWQLHKYGRQEWGDIIGERLHEGAKAKDPTGNKFTKVRGEGKQTCGEQGCLHCLMSQLSSPLLPSYSLSGTFDQSWSPETKFSYFGQKCKRSCSTLPSWAWLSSSNLPAGGQQPRQLWSQSEPNLPEFLQTSAALWCVGPFEIVIISLLGEILWVMITLMTQNW